MPVLFFFLFFVVVVVVVVVVFYWKMSFASLGLGISGSKTGIGGKVDSEEEFVTSPHPTLDEPQIIMQSVTSMFLKYKSLR